MSGHAGGWRGRVPLLCEQCGISSFGTNTAFVCVQRMLGKQGGGRYTLSAYLLAEQWHNPQIEG